MPGSVRRSDSQRSDSSTDSRKKVSFNRAVKVKKYSRPGKHTQQTTSESPEKRFWFKVYKNRHHQEPDLLKETQEYNSNHNNIQQESLLGSDTLHPSQMPTETPEIRKDHVKHIVNIFNQDSSVKPPVEKHNNGQYRPSDPPTDYNAINNAHTSKQKKNPLINGVKVIFGMNSLRKKQKDNVHKKNLLNLKKSQGTSTKTYEKQIGPHKTNIVIPDNRNYSKSSISSSSNRQNNKINKNLMIRNDHSTSSHSYHPNPTIEVWDSGDQLVTDTSHLDTSMEENADGRFYNTAEEKHQIWKREKLTRYDEPILIERKKTLSHDNLLSDRRIPLIEQTNLSTEDLRRTSKYSQSVDSLKKKVHKEDKAIQCDEFSDDSDSWDSETPSDSESCRVIRSTNGFVSAFSDVPSLGSYDRKNDVIYSQVDKSKKKKKNIRPPIAVPSNVSSQESKIKEDSYYNHTKETKIKTKTRNFGFKLNNGFHDDVYDNLIEKDWYDVDGELEEVERQKRSNATEESSDAETAPASVIREVDYKKREISYENVPRKESSKNGPVSSDRGLWFHKADDDYRRDMAFKDGVTEPSYSTLGRINKTKVNDRVSSDRSYTLDRRHLKNGNSPSNVKILVNGKQINDTAEIDKKCVRGGLAASYQARQKAALRRSNSSAANMFNQRTKSQLSPHGGSSANSGISSSGSESSRRHRPVVLYVPGVGHTDHSINEDDRSSGTNVARTQSMLSSSKPTKYQSRAKSARHSGSDKSDLSRSNSMPKDIKFPWFKWKIRAKPSREP